MILPLKLRGAISYSIPESFSDKVEVGSWAVVSLRGKSYYVVVERIGELNPGMKPSMILDLESVVPSLPPLSQQELDFIRAIAEYYLCSPGEVLKAAYPAYFFRQAERTRTVTRKSRAYNSEKHKVELSPVQAAAFDEIRKSFDRKKNVLLQGVTGSGKTELYIKLASEALAQGHNVLYLVPEIALSRQLEERLGAVFSDKLMVWHSRRTPAAKKEIYDRIKSAAAPYILLGTRSAVLLPITNLSLVVIDEEHDSSYKQEDPAPRYNGRDVALMMAARQNAQAVLGSATPSLESLYNVRQGKFTLVKLPVKFYNAPEAEVSVIDMRQVARLHNSRGSFAMKLINEIASTLESGKQVMIFRSRRSYASFVQCPSCGDVPKCPHCNVSLSYHKFSGTLDCHYCGYRTKFYGTCKNCGEGALELKGAGTERIEEELREYFPDAKVARLDGDVSMSKAAEEKVLKDFSTGVTDILVGTQMITKGFDFPSLSLVAIINADSMLSLQDFRADERALQLMRQLAGRSGRREGAGKLIIQTYQPDHRVFQLLQNSQEGEENVARYAQAALDERMQFGFPPFVRLVELSVRESDTDRLKENCDKVIRLLHKLGVEDFFGPITPQTDRIRGKYVSLFLIKLPRTARSQQLKIKLANEVESLRDVVIDVDPA
ncbi:MAG: primosomal protein N' [Bacteroidales bacterium]|nr:primosomal protein N' [Bacteroidales bacterium]